MSAKRLLLALGLLSTLCLPATAMERWVALAQLESGNRDGAVGRAGEISRYQIKPALWRRYASPTAHWTDRHQALRVARRIMAERTADFERSYGRSPTDFEFYVLWNAPAQSLHPAKAVAERARRFCDLISSPPAE